MNNVIRFALTGLVALAEIPSQRPASAAETVRPPAKVAAARVERIDPALDAVIAPGTRVEKVATGFTFTEGPIWYRGRLLFADLPASRIVALTPDGKYETLVENSGGPTEASTSEFKGSNGMVADKNGDILMTQHAARRIARLDRKLAISSVLDRYEGKRFNSPNDLVFARDGSLWFTDPPYGLRGQERDPAKEIPFSGVYRYAGGKLTAVIKDLPLPNGIGFSPDGKTLYVNNSGPAKAVWRYDVATDGTVTNGKPLMRWASTTDGIPDGLKIDTAGNVWTSGPGGIYIITPQGKLLGKIVLPEASPNLAWADDGKTAYITASTSIYRIKLAGRGAVPVYRAP